MRRSYPILEIVASLGTVLGGTCIVAGLILWSVSASPTVRLNWYYGVGLISAGLSTLFWSELSHLLLDVHRRLPEDKTSPEITVSE